MKYLLLAISMLFISCGGGSSSSLDSVNINSEQILKGVLYDSAVVGARYKTATLSGVTDNNGIFKYHKGEEVEFFINNISLGKATPKDVPNSLKDKVKANKIVTPQDLAKDDANKTIKIAQLLISLDSDNNATNGINIDISKLKDENKTGSIDTLNLDNTLYAKVPKTKVKEHLCESLGFGCDGVEDNNDENSGSDDNNQNINHAPIINGTPKEITNIYDIYRFKATAKDSDGDALTFNIQNKPSWAEFNTTTGLLKGIPTINDEGNYSNIIISVSDGNKSVSLAPFSITVKPAKNIAHLFGKATQPPKNSYDWYYEPSLAIDGNLSTFNHTQGDSTLNWWQLELPSETKIYKIVIHNRAGGTSSRLNSAKVYINDINYTGTLPTNSIATLNSDLNQTINLATPIVGKYILVKANGNHNLHMTEVEVYGTITKTKPFIANSELNTTIGRYKDKVTPIFTVNAVDYQNDILNYSIVQKSVPFRIDNSGNIYVNGLLPQDSYTFDVEVSDGVESVTKSIRVDVVDKMAVDTYYTLDTKPSLSGYLPNSYIDGDSLTVRINGHDYTPTIDNKGTWIIPKGDISPILDIGDYNISIIVNHDTPILYENYFSILGKNIQSQQFNMSSTNTIEDVQVSVTSSTSAPLPKGKVVKATDQNLSKEGGQTILYNDSYRTLHSLIATYTDSNNQKHFLRLVFNTDIEPYSRNVLNWINGNNATIFHTAGQYNLHISFGGDDCNQATNDTTIYCTPTTRNDTIYSDTANKNSNISEQQVFSRVTATWNHLYNRVDGIKSIDAYIHKTSYRDMDYSDTYQGSDTYATGATKDSFFYKRFFAALSPNNYTEFKAMRYFYNAEGRAGQPSYFSTTGERNIGAWASLWEESLWTQGKNGDIVYGAYEYIHHEMMHSHGMSHESGLTYGWPHQAAGVYIRYHYIGGQAPSVKAPKYIFDTKVLNKNHIELTLYKTSDASSNNITFEVFAGNMCRSEDISFEELSENRVKITISDSVFPRFFIRVYGDDSNEFMSKFITPKEMVAQTQSKVGSPNNNSYYLFSRAVWEAYSKFSGYQLSQSKSGKICKILSNNPDAHTAYRVDVDTIDNNLSRANLDAILQGNGSNRYFAQNVVYGDNSNGGWWNSYIYDFTNYPYSKEAHYNNTIEENGRSPIDNAILQDTDVGLICVDSL